MLTSQWILQDGISRLKNLNKLIKEKSDVEPFKPRLYGICYDMASAAEELFFNINSYRHREIKEVVLNAVKNVRATNDGLEIKNNIAEILAMFDENENFGHDTIGDFSSNKYNAITSYKKIGSNNIEQIMKAIKLTNRTITILDPRCYNGDNLQSIKTQINNSVTYGIEQEASIADVARTVVDKIAKGPFAGSKISNDAFDVIFFEPNISWNFSVQTNKFLKQEKMSFNHVIKYLRTDGIMIFVIPYYRLHKDVCVALAKNLHDVQVRRLSGDDFNDKGLVAVMGIKSSKKDIDEESYRTLRKLHTIDELPLLRTTPFEQYTLPKEAIEIEVFRGSILDMEEMKSICNNSGCIDAFWKSQEVEKLSENAKQPLLPFNVGQIGLVLTSGCLDGIVDEGDGNAHVIKGRVSKKSNKESDMLDNGSIEINETISNRVEIHVVLPNGEYKILA